METPYHNSKCNIGRALQGMVGGELTDEEQFSSGQLFRGNRYCIRDTQDKCSPEQVEAGIHFFLEQQQFRLSPYQHEKYTALPGGSIKRYLHPAHPKNIYQITISILPQRDRVMLDIGIFELSFQDVETVSEKAS